MTDIDHNSLTLATPEQAEIFKKRAREFADSLDGPGLYPNVSLLTEYFAFESGYSCRPHKCKPVKQSDELP